MMKTVFRVPYLKNRLNKFKALCYARDWTALMGESFLVVGYDIFGTPSVIKGIHKENDYAECEEGIIAIFMDGSILFTYGHGNDDGKFEYEKIKLHDI